MIISTPGSVTVSVCSPTVIVKLFFATSTFTSNVDNASTLSSRFTIPSKTDASLYLIFLALPSTNNAPSCTFKILLGSSESTAFEEITLLPLVSFSTITLIGLASSLCATTPVCSPILIFSTFASVTNTSFLIPLVVKINSLRFSSKARLTAANKPSGLTPIILLLNAKSSSAPSIDNLTSADISLPFSVSLYEIATVLVSFTVIALSVTCFCTYSDNFATASANVLVSPIILSLLSGSYVIRLDFLLSS